MIGLFIFPDKYKKQFSKLGSFTLMQKINKYEIPYKGPWKIIQMCTNVKLILQTGEIMDDIKTHYIKPYNTEVFS